MAYCSTCGTEYVVGLDRCEHCGAALPVLPPVPVAIRTDALARDIRLRRSLAGLIDFGVAAALAIVIFRALILRYRLRTRVLTLVLIFASALMPGLYILLRDSLGGKSFGKLLVGLTVVNTKYRRPSGIADSILRNLVFGFAVVPVVGWVVTLVIAIIAGVSVLSGKPSRIGEGLTDARVFDDRTAETQL